MYFYGDNFWGRFLSEIVSGIPILQFIYVCCGFAFFSDCAFLRTFSLDSNAVDRSSMRIVCIPFDRVFMSSLRACAILFLRVLLFGIVFSILFPLSCSDLIVVFGI